MSKTKPQILVESVPVVDIADDGRAVCKSDEWVIFVPHAVPGDVVDILVNRKRKNYAEGIVKAIRTYSDMRVEPQCCEFLTCGGCKWQDLDYEQQLAFKHKNVEDCLVRIGKLNVPAIPPVLPAERTYFYRNKLEFTFSSSRWLTDEEIEAGAPANRNALGFHIPGKFDKVFDVNECLLQAAPSNEIRLAVRDFATREKMSFANLRTHEGFLRTLTIRTASTGELMVIVCFHDDDRKQREKLLNFIDKTFTEVTSLMYVINPKLNDSYADLEVIPYRGKSYIMEQMEGLQFKVGPKSFYQTNSAQALRLYRIVREFARLSGSETVYDLYTGTGTIANFVASQAAKVIGVECIEDAIHDARENAQLNGLTNTTFVAGDMKDVFTTDFIAEHGKPDVVILDPPRAGVHPKVIDALLKAQPARIVYVSCNPSSQARDLALMNENYAIRAVQPVDMFPHTHHIENVVMLEAR